ncbi:MAG: DUF4124 domain-containing protein [Woeseiaceae bacterium]|jgi:hypothetical protein
MRKIIIISALALLSAPAAAAEKNVYSWEDEEGQKHYGDSIPPEYADQPKNRLNDQGVAVEKIEGKKTPEQLAEEERQKKLAVERKLQRQKDQALLATYLSIDEIVMHRDRRVELFQAQARVTELYLRNLQRRLEKLRKEASGFQPYSKDADAPMIEPDLADDLRETKETIARHIRNLQKYEADEKEIIDEFDAAIERFKRLKGLDNSVDDDQTAVAQQTSLTST